MTTPHPISEAKPLGYFIDHVAELPRWSWLYVSADETEITLDTPCRPAARDSRDMSEEEIQEFEAYCERIGLRSFFYRDQLRDIIENLRQQRSDFTSQELVAAINFYWRCDAFIDLSRSGAQPHQRNRSGEDGRGSRLSGRARFISRLDEAAMEARGYRKTTSA